MDADTPRISDPIRIRALTHPLRLELLDILVDGPATATECAEVTGESVASCSFHLRTLAKYDFIEPAERRGREKPWRLTTPGQDIRPDDDPDSVQAVSGVAQLYLEHSTESIRQWLASVTTEEDRWIQASTMTRASFWATDEELAELSDRLQNITEPFYGRNDDPSKRPEGSRPMRLLAAAHPDVVRERQQRAGG